MLDAAEIDLVDARDNLLEPDLGDLWATLGDCRGRPWEPSHVVEPVLATDAPEVATFFFTKRIALVRAAVLASVAVGVLLASVATAIADDAFESITPEPATSP